MTVATADPPATPAATSSAPMPTRAQLRAAADAEILRFCRLLWREPNEVHEVRAPSTPDRPDGTFTSTVSGYSNSPEAAAAAVAELDARGLAPAIYLTMNPSPPAVLARSVNRLKWKARETTTDEQITRRQVLLIDVDPVRPAGVMSTDAEMQKAIEKAAAIRADLGASGWPEPIQTMSGSGSGLGYGIDLPNDEASEAMIGRVLAALDATYSDDAVKIDRSVKNAARITKVAGTWVAKGDNLVGIEGVEDRPHRRSYIISAPERLEIVPRELLEQLAAEAPAEEKKPVAPPYNPPPGSNGHARGNGKVNGSAWAEFDTFDRTPAGVRGYLERHGVAVKGEQPKGGSTRLCLERCPVNPSCESGNGNDISVIVDGAGQVSYSNLHDRGDGLRWEDVREALEPGYQRWVNDSRTKQDESDRLADDIHRDGATKHAARLNSVTRSQSDRAMNRLRSVHEWDDSGIEELKRAKSADWAKRMNAAEEPSEEEQAATEAWRAAGETDNGRQHAGKGRHQKPDKGEKPPPPLFVPVTFDALAAKHPQLRPSLITGIARTGEVFNVVAPPKLGKSWFVAGLALSVASGWHWLATFPVRRGRVLLIDNELHPETIVFRINKVAEAMGLGEHEWRPNLEVLPLRGRNLTMDDLGPTIEALGAGRFDLLVMDALYRLIPKGFDENANADMTWLYNLVDGYAAMAGAAVALVHHTSKGIQGGKQVTDTGSGAGSIARAPDTHLILRPHEEEGAVVIDGAVRNFAPLSAMALRWDFPLFRPDPSLDPSLLKVEQKNKGGRPRKEDGKGDEAPPEPWTAERFAREMVSETPTPKPVIELKAGEAGLAQRMTANLIASAVHHKLIFVHNTGKTTGIAYATVAPALFNGAERECARAPHTPHAGRRKDRRPQET